MDHHSLGGNWIGWGQWHWRLYYRKKDKGHGPLAVKEFIAEFCYSKMEELRCSGAKAMALKLLKYEVTTVGGWKYEMGN